MISTKKILVVFTIVLFLINSVMCLLLLSKTKECEAAEQNKNDTDVSMVVETLMGHVYYDGDSIPCNQTVRHYGRSGKIMEVENMDDILRGNKVVMLLSTNCCSSCALEEINKLLDVARKIGRENVVFMADFALHAESSWSMCFDKEGYYETDVEHLGLKGSPSKETPIVMLTQNGRIKTSFLVGRQTCDIADSYHEYLQNYFKEKK